MDKPSLQEWSQIPIINWKNGAILGLQGGDSLWQKIKTRIKTRIKINSTRSLLKRTLRLKQQPMQRVTIKTLIRKKNKPINSKKREDACPLFSACRLRSIRNRATGFFVVLGLETEMKIHPMSVCKRTKTR